MKYRRHDLALALALACAIIFLSFSPAAAGPSQWVRVKSLHFVVYSDAGEKRAREVTERLEGFRALLAALFPEVEPANISGAFLRSIVFLGGSAR